jgi:hypothetical protein
MAAHPDFICLVAARRSVLRDLHLNRSGSWIFSSRWRSANYLERPARIEVVAPISGLLHHSTSWPETVRSDNPLSILSSPPKLFVILQTSGQRGYAFYSGAVDFSPSSAAAVKGELSQPVSDFRFAASRCRPIGFCTFAPRVDDRVTSAMMSRRTKRSAALAAALNHTLVLSYRPQSGSRIESPRAIDHWSLASATSRSGTRCWCAAGVV